MFFFLKIEKKHLHIYTSTQTRAGTGFQGCMSVYVCRFFVTFGTDSARRRSRLEVLYCGKVAHFDSMAAPKEHYGLI